MECECGQKVAETHLNMCVSIYMSWMCLMISSFASQKAAISGENVQFQCTVLLNVIKK